MSESTYIDLFNIDSGDDLNFGGLSDGVNTLVLGVDNDGNLTTDIVNVTATGNITGNSLDIDNTSLNNDTFNVIGNDLTFQVDGSDVFNITNTGVEIGSGITNYSFPLARGTNGQILVSDGSGVLTFQDQVDTNIYNIDGSLTGTRTITMNGNTFTFSGSSNVIISTTGNITAQSFQGVSAVISGSIQYDRPNGYCTLTSLAMNTVSSIPSDDVDDSIYTNKFYSETLFNSSFSGKDTDDLSEGLTNLYYTDSRFDTRLATKTTDDLIEGSNLYYTDARARLSVGATAGGNISYNGLTGKFTVPTTLDAFTVGKSDYYIQFNSGFSMRFYTPSTEALTIGSTGTDGYTWVKQNLFVGVDGINHAYEFPNVRGLADQYIKTDVNGDCSWSTISTTEITEGTNLFYTDARSRNSISATSPISYDSSTGIISAPGLSTIYTADGTLSGNRIIDLSTYNLTLRKSGTSSFTDDLVIEDSTGVQYATMAMVGASGCTISFCDAVSQEGFIEYRHSDDSMRFSCADTVLMNLRKEFFATISTNGTTSYLDEDSNILLGIGSASGVSVSNNNIIIGKDASLASNNSNCISIGTESCTEEFGISIGYRAGKTGATSNRRNIFIGREASYLNTTSGTDNVAIGGYRTGYSLSSGYRNTFLNRQAGFNCTTGYDNICVGYEAGNTITTGNGNIIFGYLADVNSGTDVNSFAIGDGTIAGGSNQYWYGNSSVNRHVFQTGNVGINTTSPGTNFHVLKGGTAVSNTAFCAILQNSALTSDNSRLSIVSGTAGNAQIDFGDTADNTQGAVVYNNNTDHMLFHTTGTTRMTIDDTGRVGINVGSFSNANVSADNLIVGNTGVTAGITITNSSSASTGGIYFSRGSTSDDSYRGRIVYDQSTSTLKLLSGTAECNLTYNGILTMYRPTISTGAAVFRCRSDVTVTEDKFVVRANGDVESKTNSYGALTSDPRLKENVTPASSQWEDVKGLGQCMVNYQIKSDVQEDPDNALVMLGWLSSDVHTISPVLAPLREKEDWMEPYIPTVIDSETGQPTLESSTYRTVKTSVICLKAVKALSEAQMRIESLESQLQSVLSRLDALENPV